MEMSRIWEILKELDIIIDSITNPNKFLKMYPLELSELEVRLAGYRATLAEGVAGADTAALRQTAYTEHIHAKKFLEIKKLNPKMPSGEINATVDSELWEAREKEFDAMKLAKHLKLRHASYESVINAIKDRIKVLQGEKFDKTGGG